MGGPKVALPIKDRQRLTKSLPSKGGGGPERQSLKLKIPTKLSGEGEKVYGGLEICLEVQLEIDQGLLKTSATGGIYLRSSKRVRNAIW